MLYVKPGRGSGLIFISISIFIHKIYILVARKLYTNIYLFEIEISPLEKQKNNRELEIIVKECIMNTIRENMPIETILKAYVDESYDECIEVQEEIINDPKIDCIFICTPNFLNKKLTMQSLKAGKHVFCEKPPAFTAKNRSGLIHGKNQV